MAGHTKAVPPHTAEGLAEVLRPLTDAPEKAAIFCDVDGTLAPIVERPDDARVPDDTARVLAVLGRRYRCVACVSGRGASDARRLVGVGAIVYAGAHGAELLHPGMTRPDVAPDFAAAGEPVRRLALAVDETELRELKLRREDKGPIVAFHWREAEDEEAARERVAAIAADAERAGLIAHWGRKVLEVRPAVAIDKGRAVRRLVSEYGVRTALFGGDDTTDVDAFRALEELVADGQLDSAVRVGVLSDETPEGIVERADLTVDGVGGFARVLAALAEA